MISTASNCFTDFSPFIHPQIPGAPPSTHLDSSRSRPSRWHRISAWRSTRAWTRGLGFGRSCGLPGLCPGTAAHSHGSLSTLSRESLSPCEKRSHCSSPVQRSLLNSGGELWAHTIIQSAIQSLFRWWIKKHTLTYSLSHITFHSMNISTGAAIKTYRILFWL